MKNDGLLKIVLFALIIISIVFLTYKIFLGKKDNPPSNQEPTTYKYKGDKIYNDIYLEFQDNKNVLSTNNSDVIFTLKGDNISNNIIYYEITLNYEQVSNNYINSDLVFNLISLDDNNTLSTGSYNTINNRIIYIGKIEGLSNIDKKYKLEVLSKNKDYNNIIVSVNIASEEKKLPILGYELVLNSINNHPNTTWTDVDNVIYFSGEENTINYNYVWYSGKLWRIMALNPDGSMKLITDNMMTTIAWGKNIEYNGSWVYQWLNEDFYDTLYDPNNILVTDATWNYTTDGNRIPSKPDTLPNQKTVNAPIGLISSYEYYVASKLCDTLSSGAKKSNYLDIHHRFWHITPQHDKAVRSTFEDGKQDLYDRHPGNYQRAIRPSIYLNKYVEFTGTGTKNDPYKIIGDIPNVNNNDLLNTRISGEYVLFDNDVYRIIDIFDNKAKIMRVDYLRNGNKGIEIHIARTIVYGNPAHPQNSEWWDYYLPNIWFPTISLDYQKMVVDGIYYLGKYPDYTSYKNTICTDANLDSVRVKDCNKYTASDKIYIGKVGISRIGEMFAAQQLDYETVPLKMWTITPYDDVENRIVHDSNSLWRHATWGGFHVVHPTLYLKESIKITGGDGTFNNPYTISE